MLLHDKCHHIPRFYRIENRTRHTRHCKSTWAMFLFGNINLRSAPMKAVADRKPLELKIRTKNDQGLVCMVLAYPSYLNSLLQLPWSINPIIGKTSLNGIFTLGIYATSGVSWIVVLIVPFENKTGCFHHAGSFFFTTNRKRKKRSSSVGQYEAPFINCLPSYLCQLDISHLRHGVLDSRQALLLRIERHRRPGETIQRKWMRNTSRFIPGFWVGQSSFC